MPLNPFLQHLKILAKKEKKLKEYISRVRAKGRIAAKTLTKNNNIKLTLKKGDDKYNFIILKTHKEKYHLAENLPIGAFLWAEGKRHLRMIICTRMKMLEHLDESRQAELIA